MFDENNIKVDLNESDHLPEGKKVEEEGGGVTIISSDKLSERIEEIVSDLETKTKKRISKSKREVIEFIAISAYQKRGITKDRIAKRFNYSIDYAEKIIFGLKANNLLVSTGIRKGHMMTYFLSNMQDHIQRRNLDNKKSIDKSNGHSCLDDEILSILFKHLTANKGVFHNFRLQTRLRDKEDYELLKISNNAIWKLQSVKSKIKVTEIAISRFRRVKLQISPNGTVEIYIASSRNPYDLHHDIGLSEFFADLGKIEILMETEFGYSLPFEHFYDWHIVRVDYNYDIEDIDVSYLSSGTTILQVKHLSHLYQFYTKQLPDKGLVLTIEEHLSLPKPYPKIKDFASTLNK